MAAAVGTASVGSGYGYTVCAQGASGLQYPERPVEDGAL